MMCNKCGSENITTGFICGNCGHDCQPERTTSGTIPMYFKTMPWVDNTRVTIKRTVIGEVTPLYQGAI